MSFKQEVLDKSEDLKVCYYRYIDVLKLKDSEGSFNLFIREIFIASHRLDNTNWAVDFNNSHWFISNYTLTIEDSNSIGECMSLTSV